MTQKGGKIVKRSDKTCHNVVSYMRKPRIAASKNSYRKHILKCYAHKYLLSLIIFESKNSLVTSLLILIIMKTHFVMI